MSIVSSDVAIISIGCSCQVTHNLDLLKESISSHFGTEFKRSAQYFDYIICPIPTADQFIRCFPDLADRHEVVVRASAPYWIKYKIEFSHNFRLHGLMYGEVDIDAEFDVGKNKIAYLRNKWIKTLQTVNRVIFVVGNAQPTLKNMPHVENFDDDFAFTQSKIRSLNEGLQDVAGHRMIGLLVIESAETHSGPWSLEKVVRKNVGPAGREWSGDTLQWQKALLSGLDELLEARI